MGGNDAQKAQTSGGGDMQSKLIGMAMAEAMKVSLPHYIISGMLLSFDLDADTHIVWSVSSVHEQLFSSSGGKTADGGGQQDIVNAAGKREYVALMSQVTFFLGARLLILFVRLSLLSKQR
jgi:hypothetical protein